MDRWVSSLEHITVGLYEKALPAALTWPERLAAAARAGYDFVEIAIDDSDGRIARLEWTPAQRAELRRAAEETGVPVRSMSLSAHRRFPLGSASPEMRQRGIDILLRAIDFGLDVGLRHILLCGAEDYYETITDDTRARFREGLSRGFEHASACGVMLALENWDVGVNSIQQAMDYVNYFNSPWFQLYADVGNLTYAGRDVCAELKLGRGHIAAVHLKDTLPGQLRYVPLGEGSVPFTEAMATLAEVGFQGPVCLELWTEKDPRAVEIVSDARQWVREQMQAGWQLHAQRSAAAKGVTTP